MKKILISLSVISLIFVTVLVFILSIDRNNVELTVNDENENQIIESNNSIEEEEEILDESITDNNENIESAKHIKNFYYEQHGRHTVAGLAATGYNGGVNKEKYGQDIAYIMKESLDYIISTKK